MLLEGVECYIKSSFPDRRGSRGWLDLGLDWHRLLGLCLSVAASVWFLYSGLRLLCSRWLSWLCACRGRGRRSWLGLRGWWRGRFGLWWWLQKRSKHKNLMLSFFLDYAFHLL